MQKIINQLINLEKICEGTVSFNIEIHSDGTSHLIADGTKCVLVIEASDSIDKALREYALTLKSE